jgi:hypothetical protein
VVTEDRHRPTVPQDLFWATPLGLSLLFPVTQVEV